MENIKNQNPAISPNCQKSIIAIFLKIEKFDFLRFYKQMNKSIWDIFKTLVFCMLFVCLRVVCRFLRPLKNDEHLRKVWAIIFDDF